MISPPSLLYHKIGDEWEAGVTFLQPQRFALQMQLLYDAGWQTILPAEKQVSDKQFYLVFDDGYESIFTKALPILNKLGFRAVVFVPTDYIGCWNDWDHQLLGRRFRHLDRSMLQELVSAGWMVGSHGMTHRNMTSLSSADCLREWSNSRLLLQEITGQPVEWVAFPFGRYNKQVVDAARETGYIGGITPVLNGNVGREDFVIHRTDPVYLWDCATLIRSRVKRNGVAYQLGRAFRQMVNRCATGTTAYNWLVQREKNEP